MVGSLGAPPPRHLVAPGRDLIRPLVPIPRRVPLRGNLGEVRDGLPPHADTRGTASRLRPLSSCHDAPREATDAETPRHEGSPRRAHSTPAARSSRGRFPAPRGAGPRRTRGRRRATCRPWLECMRSRRGTPPANGSPTPATRGPVSQPSLPPLKIFEEVGRYPAPYPATEVVLEDVTDQGEPLPRILGGSRLGR
ncbi:MAG: hypothetical protein RLZZ299_1440 [Pseudomonadota bacterium]|jgi:hypothetical protein